MMKSLRILACAALASWTSGCLWILHSVDVKPVAAHRDTLTTTSPVKVHLRDGSIVMYARGVAIAADTLRGDGTHYDRTVSDWSPVTRVPADSVAAMEVFETQVEDGKTIAVSASTTALVVGGLYLLVSNMKLHFTHSAAAAAAHP